MRECCLRGIVDCLTFVHFVAILAFPLCVFQGDGDVVELSAFSSKYSMCKQLESENAWETVSGIRIGTERNDLVDAVGKIVPGIKQFGNVCMN